ncbi:hypothetical protein GGI20_004269 [Coemansia sp. BCRC 34301]|nr:hypothetical protein GGI20_004269 [Coemansia sp. BCRC 34301]
MVTLAWLITEYGKVVDRELIASIWTEQGLDQAKCHNIIHMLSGGSDENCSNVSSSSTAATPTGAKFSASSHTSTQWSEVLSTGSPQSGSVCSGSSNGGQRPSRERLVSGARPEAIQSLDTLLDFLRTCFPECGADYLRAEATKMFGGANLQVDPIEAIDMISNALYNDMEAVDNQQYRQLSSGKPPAINTADTSLASIEAQYTVPGAKPSKEWKKPKGPKRRPVLAAPASSKVWCTKDTELDFLYQMFPMLGVGTVASAYHEHTANLNLVVSALTSLATQQELAKQQKPRTSNNVLKSLKSPMGHSEKRMRKAVAALRELFPDHSEDVLAEAAAKSTDVDAAAERLLQAPVPPPPPLLLPPPMEHRPSGSKSRKTNWQRVDLSNHSIAVRPGAGMEEHDPTERLPLSALAKDAREWVALHSADAAYCRKRAAALFAERNELYTKAAHAYSRRTAKGAHSGTALFYSSVGHKCDASARVWRMRAAQAAVAAMRRNDSNLVDLHGLTRMEALAVVQDELLAWYDRDRSRPLRIVTGLGSHSIDSCARLHPAVIHALRDAGWRFSENPGYIEVLGKPSS